MESYDVVVCGARLAGCALAGIEGELIAQANARKHRLCDVHLIHLYD